MHFDLETEVLVIGAGGCGLAAAVAAHDAGAQVMVVEKLDRAGGNTALSTGSVPGAGSKYQRERGIEDSPERMVEDLLRLSGPHDAPELVEFLARESAPLVDWLVESVGARMRLIHEYKHVGHSVPRLHAPDSRRGKDLFDDLMHAVETRGVPVAVGNPVAELLADSRGELAGARVQGNNVKPYSVRARKIVLATNGYAANRALVVRFCPEIAGAEYFGARGSEGEAILWGEKLGAAFCNIGAYQGYAAIAYPHGSLLSWTTMEKGGILVDEAGRRFGNEGIGYSGFAREVLAQKQKVFAVFDQRICDIAMNESEFREQFELGGFKRDFGIGVLNETVNNYKRAARGEVPDPFGRSDFGIAPLAPPLFACQVVAGLFHTQGGLRVDTQARVLRTDGSAITHLFAGGGAAAGISGRDGARGYASGNGLLAAIGLGRIAGRQAAKELRQ
jgi:fumarate reductase flavoprotein subunit